MKILVACEESQAVTVELRKLGHEAYSCDIIECSGGHPEWHIMQDVLPLLNGKCEFKTCDGTLHSVFGKWDMIIAHPPCTYLSNAGACHLWKGHKLNEERYKKGLEGKKFFMEFLEADCDHIAIENPVSSRIYEMPQFSQEIQPYQYGHPVSKKTRLWLKNLPLLIPTNIVEKKSTFLPSYTSKFKGTDKNKNTTRSAREASKTFSGIAKAMANQWTEGV